MIKEISKKTDLGKTIEEYYQNLKYVPDDIVIELVKKHMATLEKEKKSYILEGFPKTRVQGLALQRAGIIPDSFLVLNLPEEEIERASAYEEFKDIVVICCIGERFRMVRISGIMWLTRQNWPATMHWNINCKLLAL